MGSHLLAVEISYRHGGSATHGRRALPLGMGLW